MIPSHYSLVEAKWKGQGRGLHKCLEKEVVHVLQKQARVDQGSDQHSE